MYRECEAEMYYHKGWRRLIDRILYGHPKHVCIQMRPFAMPHEGPHKCGCGKTFDPISTNNN